MARIKNIGNFLFVAVFMLLLWVPMLHINQDTQSRTENRMLATIPHWTVNGKINGKFGEEFNAWFSDRFFGRNTLIRAHNKFIGMIQIDESAPDNHPGVLIGRENWLFFKGDDSIKNYTNSSILDMDQMANGLQYLTDINNWCKQHNKKFYVMIAPDKNKIYPEFYPDSIKKARPDSFGIGMTFYEYIRNHSDINIMYPYNELIAAKDSDTLYYTNDSHWNMRGSYMAFKILHDRVFNHEFNENKFIRQWTDERHYGDLVKMLDLRDNSKYMQNTFKKPEFIHDIKCHQTKKYASSRGLIECKNPNGKLNAYMFRDSFSAALIPYMAQVFNTADFHWKHNIEKSDLDAIANNYDVVILELVERLIPKFLHNQFPGD